MKMKMNKRARLITGMIGKPTMSVRLSGTGARPNQQGYYCLTEMRRSGKVVVLAEGETPYQAIARAGLYGRWQGEVPRPGWAFLSVRATV